MENRLPNVQRLLLILAGLFTFCTTSLAQVDITFEYNGPDTIYVDSGCTAPLDWGAPSSVGITCNTPGCVITSFNLFFISGGYSELDLVPGGTTVLITYKAEYTINGQAGSLSFTFEIDFVDNTLPVFDAGTLPPDDSYNCLAEVPVPPMPTATDNCPPPGGGSTGVTVVYDGQTTPPVTCNGGSFTRSWTASDDAGNQTTYTQTITVSGDNDDPVITGTPVGATELCETADYATWLAAQRATFAATDNGCGLLELTDDAPATYDADCSSIDVTFTATDSCSNSTSVLVTYSIIDNTAPVITIPAMTNITLQCDGLPTDPTSQIIDWQDNLMVSDNCTAVGDIIWTNTFTTLSGGCGGATGTAIVDYYAEDLCGNRDTLTLNFTVLDSNDPDIVTGAVDTTVICDGAGNTAELADWLTNRGYADASDVCTDDNDLTLTLRINGNVQTPAMVQDSVDTMLENGCGATVTVEFSFTDLCGNTSTTNGEFVVIDTLAPTITVIAQTAIVECDAPSISFADWLNSRGGAMASDVCYTIDNSPTSTNWTSNITSDVPGACFNESTRTVEFTVTDQCGLQSTTTAQYIVEDNSSPTIMPTATDLVEECGGGNDQAVLNAWIDSFGGAAASDVCSSVTWNILSYTTSVGAVDANISFGDTLNYPQIVPNDCDWSVEVTFTVVDECNNASTTMASFFMIDVTDPVLAGVNMVNDTLVIDCNAPTPGFPNITATDNCDASVNITVDSTQTQLSCVYNFVRQRTWTATDDCNNTSTISQVLIVQDTTKPFLTGLPIDMTVDCDAVPSAPVLGTDYTANDNCDGAIDNGVAFVEVNAQGSDPNVCDFYNYTITRVWTVTDICNNSNVYTQIITVQDTLSPTFTVPADTLVDCHTDLMPLGTGNPTNVLDVCDADPDISFVDVITSMPGSCPNDYTIQRTWTVTDACGNASVSQLQTIMVQDTLTPTFTVQAVNVDLECSTETTAQDSFINWVNANGNSAATDLCTDLIDLTWFAALPGSYDISDPGTWPGIAPGGLTTATCPSPIPGIYRTDTVDFVVYDECDNANVSTAVFNIIDTDDPVFDYCPDDDNVETDPGECYNLYTLPAPIISDGCNAVAMYNFVETEPIASSSPGDDATAVNTVVITFGSLPTPPVVATGMVSLNLDFIELDGEEPTEFFNIFGDDGSFLGVTANTATQCGSITTTLMISAVDFNLWAADGVVNINLVPNIPTGQPGTFAINDICPDLSGTGGGTEVTATLDYSANDPNGMVFQYNINNGPLMTINPIADVIDTMLVGTNEITYYATDCAGNAGTCSFTIEVEDTEDPVITCPADVVYNLAADEGCGDVDVQMEIPILVTDNCPFNLNTQTQPNNTNDALLTFTYNPNYLEYVADDKDFTFVGTAANAVGTVATFTVTITGDADDSEEFFTIYDEDGNVLGTTEVGQPNVAVTAASCPTPGQTVAVFTVPVDLFNTWAADGSVEVTAVSNNTFIAPPSGGPDDGINPSCVTFPANTPDGSDDGVSSIYIVLEYESTTIYYYTTGATTTALTQMLPPAIAPIINFDKGDTEVFYTVTDNGANEVSCSFTVSVNDVLPPIIDCDATTIFVNPSGLQDYELEWYEIENGSDSYDENCVIDNYTVSPNMFDCTMVDQAIVVTLTATDDSGNSTSCTSLVSVEVEEPEPDYSIGLCGDDNLYLFANPPNSFGQFVYTFVWYDPDGNIIATDEDPVIAGVDASDSGVYMVELEGLTGCTAFGVINVMISSSPNVPVISADETNLCVNDQLVLTTQTYSGTSVEYKWYSGIAPGGTLLDSTTIPQYIISAPLATGDETYYVIVEVDGCFSDASFFETVTVDDAPVATTNSAVINICEGEDIILGTSVAGTGYTYQWSGPNGFVSTSQFPQVISNADLISGGTYNLVITSSNCESNIATTVVNITPTPQTPIISTVGVACLGDDITLLANINNADSYTWIAPDFSEIVTATNSLILTNVTTNQTGNWSVYVTANGCVSETSSSVSIFVEPTLTVVASNDGPICEGGDVQLLVNTIPGATYLWSGPAGMSSASQNPITTAVAGMYSVLVTSSTGCSNTANTSVAVSEAPIITALSNTGAPCVTGADDILLVPTVFPPDVNGDYTYLWDGPNQFISTDASPLLPNGTSIDNGSYVLVVTNAAGCASNAVTTVVNVSDAPQTPLMDAPVGLCEGGTLTLTTSGYVGSSVTYTWMTPLGTITTNVPSLTIPNVTAASSGNYAVLVTVDGCTSNSSATAVITVGPVPSTPVVTSNSPVCEGETITFLTDLIPNAEYEWTGPANFNSTLHNPFVFSATEDNSGTYQVQVIINGCPSVFSVPVNVDVNEAPESAIAENDGPVCIDDTGTTLLLSVAAASALPGATYTWYDAQTGELVAGPTASLNATIVDFANYGEGLFDFYVVTTLDDCSSVNSIPTTVEMNTIPSNEAFAGADVTVCTNQSVSLSATAPTIGTGSWVQLSGPSAVIVNPNSPTTPLTGLTAGNSYTFLWRLSNGACGEYSTDEVVVSVDSNTDTANSGLDINLCNETSVTLSATAASTDNIGVWTQTPAQAALGISILDPSDPNTMVTGLEPGNNYSFIWSLSNTGCGEFAADEVIVEIEESNVVALAGNDFSDCGGGDIELAAEETTSGQGTWSTADASIDILEPNNRMTIVSGLATGVYTFIWTLDNGSCGTTVDSIVVDYEAAPVAVDDLLNVEFAGQNSIDVTVNDDISGDYIIALTLNAKNGSVTNPGGGEFLYMATNAFAGADSFTYEICSEICPLECSTGVVVVEVGENAACITPSIFTPNNDGVNDEFIIPCLATDRFPSNEVSIFNQWGDEVFRSSPYLNNWIGTYNGDDLPVGTYFYVIEFGNGEEIQSGFIVLER